MSVDCDSVVAYGHILTEEEYFLLEERFDDSIYEKLDEYNEDYSCHLICRNSYSDKIHQNYLLGEEIIYISDGCFQPICESLEDKALEKEIQKDVEKILGYPVECNYYGFCRWW